MSKKIAITGATGFIGASLYQYLLKNGYEDAEIDLFDYEGISRWKYFIDTPNFVGKIRPPFSLMSNLLEALSYEKCIRPYDAIIHLGANSSTTCEANSCTVDQNIYFTNNLIDESKRANIKLIFASSASIYGNEEEDFTERTVNVKPINFYAYTKLCCDRMIEQSPHRDNIYSLRFFNVYGNEKEAHKEGQSSVIYKWLKQKESYISLFKSDNPKYQDGEQRRDFVFIDDICAVIQHCIETEEKLGDIYNVGSGVATTWIEVARNIIKERSNRSGSLHYKVCFIPMPEKLIGQYQYNTKADISKLRTKLKYTAPMTSIEDGIAKAAKSILD